VDESVLLPVETLDEAGALAGAVPPGVEEVTITTAAESETAAA
jgi:hypothetical protein